MKRSSSYLLIAVTAMIVTSGSVTASAQGRKTRPNKQGIARTVHYPKIRAAIASLEAARVELENSGKDFGGHKQEAIDAVNDALKRLRLALQFEKY